MSCGFILKNEMYKIGQKIGTKKKRFILLGSTNILIFRDEDFKSLCNIIHILPGNILFHYYMKQNKLKIDTSHRSYNLYFYNSDVLSIWESVMIINNYLDSH